MIIQHIGTRALSMYIPEEALQAFGLCPDAVGPREAQDLLLAALDKKNLGGWEAAEMEVFPGKNSLLLFARRKSSVPSHFFFKNVEDLIAAAALCPDSLPSSLHRCGGGYLLTVYPFEGDRPPAVLCEFGTERSASPHLPAHLTEQGDALIATGALEALQAFFA